MGVSSTTISLSICFVWRIWRRNSPICSILQSKMLLQRRSSPRCSTRRLWMRSMHVLSGRLWFGIWPSSLTSPLAAWSKTCGQTVPPWWRTKSQLSFESSLSRTRFQRFRRWPCFARVPASYLTFVSHQVTMSKMSASSMNLKEMRHFKMLSNLLTPTSRQFRAMVGAKCSYFSQVWLIVTQVTYRRQ